MIADNGGACTGNTKRQADRETRNALICDAFIDGASIIGIARSFKHTRNHVALILANAGLLDEDDDKLTPEKTKRMCERHLMDLERERGEKR